MTVAVLAPSRGMVLARGAEALDSELAGVPNVRLYEHDKGIPEAFNLLAARFLETGAELAWFVEEDIVVPPGSLNEMIQTGADVAAIDYWLKLETPMLSQKYYREALHWVALGCTLVKRKVFEAIQPPWFRSDLMPQLVHSGSASSWQEQIRPRNARVYGGQDVYFCAVARRAGFRLAVAREGTLLAEHWRVEPWSGLGTPNLSRILPVGRSGKPGNVFPSRANPSPT